MFDAIWNFIVHPVLAAADPALVNAAGDMATSVKDNVTGAALSSTVVTVMGTLVGIMLVILVIFKLVKRASK